MAGEEIQRQRGRGRFEIWSQQRYRRWSAPASACSPARIISREPLALFMPKNTHIHARSHTFLPPDFISKTACRALGVIGCPFSLLMASGEGRRERTRGQLVKLLSFITKLHLNLTFWLVFFFFLSFFLSPFSVATIVLTHGSFVLLFTSYLNLFLCFCWGTKEGTKYLEWGRPPKDLNKHVTEVYIIRSNHMIYTLVTCLFKWWNVCTYWRTVRRWKGKGTT